MVWGVDGGGTSTRGIAQLGQDCYTDIMSASASNILVVGQDAAFAAMDAVLDRLETSVALNSGSGLLGLAGCDRAAVRQAWREYCLKRGLKRIWITGDYWLPWANFTHGEDGLVAILGKRKKAHRQAYCGPRITTVNRLRWHKPVVRSRRRQHPLIPSGIDFYAKALHYAPTGQSVLSH